MVLAYFCLLGTFATALALTTDLPVIATAFQTGGITTSPHHHHAGRRRRRQYHQRSSIVVDTDTRLNSIPDGFDTLTSGLASICRLPRGVTVIEQQQKTTATATTTAPSMTLYDVENEKHCRLVRERLTELDLNYQVVPAAPNSNVMTDPSNEYYYAPLADKDKSIPILVVGDGTTKERRLFNGVDAILSYLDDTYGTSATDTTSDGEQQEDTAAMMTAKNVVATVGNELAGWLRIGRGCQVSPAAVARPATKREPLILYSYEGNQFCRLVREILTELDLVHEIKSCGKGSPRREELAALTGGSSQCPYLVDPNTGTSMAESAAIIQYLYTRYGKYTPPNEILQFASDTVLPLFKPVFRYLAQIQAGSRQDDTEQYQSDLTKARSEIEDEIRQDAIVIYTYELSPFSWETKALLDRLVDDGTIPQYKERSLGKEWFPGFIDAAGGAQKRAAFLEMTGQSSLPQIFVNGQSVGGLFDGLVPALNDGRFFQLLQEDVAASSTTEPVT